MPEFNVEKLTNLTPAEREMARKQLAHKSSSVSDFAAEQLFGFLNQVNAARQEQRPQTLRELHAAKLTELQPPIKTLRKAV